MTDLVGRWDVLFVLGLLVSFFFGFYLGVVHGANAWREWAVEQRRKRKDDMK